MARGLRDGSGGAQLISYHGSGQTSSSTWYHKADWLDFNTIQSGHTFASDSYAFVCKDYAMSPAKPTVDMEPAYENHPTGAGKPRVDAHKVRTQAYAAMLTGAAGHAYGSLDLFWFFKPANGPFPKDGFHDWRTAMNYPAAGQMHMMRRLVERFPWYKLVPDRSLLASEPGTGPFRLVAAPGRGRELRDLLLAPRPVLPRPDGQARPRESESPLVRPARRELARDRRVRQLGRSRIQPRHRVVRGTTGCSCWTLLARTPRGEASRELKWLAGATPEHHSAIPWEWESGGTELMEGCSQSLDHPV